MTDVMAKKDIKLVLERLVVMEDEEVVVKKQVRLYTSEGAELHKAHSRQYSISLPESIWIRLSFKLSKLSSSNQDGFFSFFLPFDPNVPIGIKCPSVCRASR